MYKAIKDNKIIGINETNEFCGLNYDEIVEDTEHTRDDYDLYYYDGVNSEYLLKSEIPTPTHNEQSEKRKAAYEEQIDKLHSRKLRHLVLDDWTEEDEKEYKAMVIQLSKEIEEEFPYYD